MPYIKQEQREKWNGTLERIASVIEVIPKEQLAGEMNYLITSILHKTSPSGYKDYNELIGVLECAKLELYRRQVAPYEDKKIAENGYVE